MPTRPTQPTLQITPQVYLYEAGSAPPKVPLNAIALPQLPSRAFGDGTHPTTRLCAGAVDFLTRQEKPAHVLDVGTGTGILARIARARGANDCVGTDIDPEALQAAQSNAALDPNPGQILFVHQLPDYWGPRFNLVVANILEAPIRELSPHLTQALAPDGALLLSGFTRVQTPGLQVIFTSLGLSLVSESHLDEWALLMFRRDNF